MQGGSLGHLKSTFLTLRSYKPYTGLLLLYVSCLHKTMASSVLSFYVMHCWHRVRKCLLKRTRSYHNSTSSLTHCSFYPTPAQGFDLALLR